MLAFERESTRVHSLEKSLLKRLWAIAGQDYGMNYKFLFCEPEENHENKVERTSHRVSVVVF